MRDTKPSSTAAWVAVGRGLADALPADARIATDRFGLGFASERLAHVGRLPAPLLLPLRPFLLYMQVRTRVIDDVLRTFVADGGTQVVILGAGYDARAARFRAELGAARVFEVDHPATQARKRDVLSERGVQDDPVDYVSWDFERRPLSELPDALQALGHDRAAPTLTLWEGVTMYLSEPAIDAAVRAVAALSAPGSPFLATYIDRALFERPSLFRQVVGRFVARAGEPFTFGWHPGALPGWMAERDWTVAWDRNARDLAGDVLPRRHARWMQFSGNRIVVSTRGA